MAPPVPVPDAAAEPAEERPSDEPYIETSRCTSCDECTQISNKMFAYDANKQASIVDPDAGTYRQLVEAAESCQVCIIHPGKPRNPNEPGLDDLIKRAEPFL
jgi:ferredoxin